MGKKKRSNQNSNNMVGDSSESESSKDSTQPADATNKAICHHVNKSVEISNVRKNLKTSRDKNTHNVCSMCKKNEAGACKDGWVCLRCGSCNCGPEEEDHRTDHYKTPHSDAHNLAYQINNNIVWCFICNREIPVDISKKVQGCVDLIKKQFNDNFPFSPVRIETDTKKMNGTDGSDFLKDRMSGAPLLSISENKTIPVLNLPKVRGLSNLGNTCFFNSVLQCLAQTPGLVDLLKQMDEPGEKFHIELNGNTIDATLEKHKTSQLSEQLAQILTEVAGVPAGGDHHTVNPRRLLDALTSKCPQFEGGDQHDAHELLRHLLDSVHTEDLRRYQKAILNHIGYNNNLDELEEDKKKFAKKVNQLVCDTIPIRPDQIFKGSLVSILRCTECEHTSMREEPFLDLSLPVAQEKAQPPRRKVNCSSPGEEEQTLLDKKETMSKHQLKKEAKEARKKNKRNRNGQKKETAQGEPTIEEEDKKDKEEQSDADVEDNEDNTCEEHDHKTEIVESGYSSEKQMSARGSPVTTQSPEGEAKFDFKSNEQDHPISLLGKINPDFVKQTNMFPMTYSSSSSLPEDPETLLAKRAESGLGSIQELTVTIPDEVNTECNSQDSVRVNASNGSPDNGSDSQQSNFRNVDLSFSSSSEYKLPPSNESQIDRNTMIYDWNCSGDVKSFSQDSSSVSISLSPLHGSGSHSNGSQKNSPGSNDNMSICTSLPLSNDMSVCNSLPENMSSILKSPGKSQQEDNSGSDERPESRMDCRKNRSSPVGPGEMTELDSGLLKLSLEGMTCAADMDTDGADDVKLNTAEPLCHVDRYKSPIPLPPPPPPTQLFSAPYNFTHPTSAPPVPTIPRNSPSTPYFPKYKTEEGEFSLHSCLGQFTCMEYLSGANKAHCEACTERLNKGNKEGKPVYQTSSKQLLISKLPPVIIFHLKRFQVQRCSFRKISRHVDFPLMLDISKFCSINEKQPILYSLYGVVEHSGTLHGGHYVAYVKVRSHADRMPGHPPPGKWYYISDSRVSDVDESSVLKTQAYLLFYERIF